MTQPTERSMPAAMMTKVWPRPSRSIGVMATRMFCELRTVRKLTEPPLTIGTATTKKMIIRPRNAQAHNRLSASMNRFGGVRVCAVSPILLPASFLTRATNLGPHERM